MALIIGMNEILIDPEKVAEYLAIRAWEQDTGHNAQGELYELRVDKNGNMYTGIKEFWVHHFFNLKEAYLLVLNEFKSDNKWSYIENPTG